MKHFEWAWRGALITLLGLTGIQGSAAAQADRYIVSPGDVLSIQIWAGGEKQEDFTTVVSSERSVMIPLAGTVPVGGLSSSGVSTRLRQLLSRGYYVNPQVLGNVKDYGGRITGLGEVRSPGIYPLGP